MKRKFSKCLSAVLAASMVFTLAQPATLNTILAADEDTAETTVESEEPTEDSDVDSAYEAVNESDEGITEEEVIVTAEESDAAAEEAEDAAAEESNEETVTETAEEAATETNTENDAETTEETTAEETTADYSGQVDTVTVNGTECYYFVPDSDLVGTRTCSSPIFVVFGDEDYTAETALAEAHTSGLAKLAEEEGSIVVFASSSGNTWSSDDDGLYAAILDTFSDSSTNTYVDGKTSDGVYAGTAERIYIYAEGSGADFVAARYLQAVISSITYSDGYTRTVNITPTCVNLFNVSVLADSAYEDTEVPAVVVNGPEGYESLLASLNPDNGKYDVTTSSVTDGFDAETLLAEYEAVTGTVRRQSGIIAPVTDYASYGITESINYYDIDAGTLKVYEYFTDTTANAEDGTIPVVMLYHGGGSTAEYVAMASDWPVLGSQENFIVFSVQDHTSYTSDDMTELLYQLEEKYPQIDTSRIYATGFSMGAVKSWNTGMKYTSVYAGIIPMDAGYMSEEDGSYSMDGIEISDLIMPVFYVAGTASPLPEMPHQAGESNNVDQMLEVYFDMNNIEGGYTYDETVDNIWGIESDATETVTAIRFGTDLTIDYYNSEDGNCYTALCAVNGKQHEVYPTETYAAWAFISQFSRNEDGTVTLASAETTYNTTDLETAIAEAEALEESNYTAKSWSALQEALTAAKAALAAQESQEAIDAAAANLNAAINALELFSETKESDADDTTNTESTADSTTSTSTAKTGDYGTVSVWLILFAAGGLAAVIALRKRLAK